MWTLDKTLRGPRPKQGSDDRTLSWQLALEKSNYGPAQRPCTWTGTPPATASVGRCWGHGTTPARS